MSAIVEQLIDHRGNLKRRSELEFRVKWLGYDEEDNTWEPFKFLRQVPRLHDYLRGKKGLNGLIPKEFKI